MKRLGSWVQLREEQKTPVLACAFPVAVDGRGVGTSQTYPGSCGRRGEQPESGEPQGSVQQVMEILWYDPV